MDSDYKIKHADTKHKDTKDTEVADKDQIKIGFNMDSYRKQFTFRCKYN